MGLIVANVVNQQAATAGANSQAEDIKFTFSAHAIHYNLFGLGLTTSTATLQNFVDKLTSVNLNTIRGQPESTIDGDDWFDLLPFIGIERYISILTAADNIPHACGLVYPLSPFPNDPTKNFGSGPNQLTQLVSNFSADVAGDFDGYTFDITVEGVDASDKPNPLGYLKFVQDSFTSGAVDSVRKTDVTGSRLLGAFNFQTTAFDDLAAAAAFNVTGIREQAVSFSDNIKVGPYKPSRTWSMQPAFRTTASPTMVLDLGHFLADYGWKNASGALGLNIEGANIKIETRAGVASEATRVYGCTLVRNGA